MKTTFSRTLMTFAVIMLATLLLLGFSLQLLVQNYLQDQAMESLRNDSAIIADVAAAFYAETSLTDEDFLINLSIVANVSDTDAVICDETGKLVLCSHAPLGCEHQGMQMDKAYLEQVYTTDYLSGTGMIGGLYEDARYVVSRAIRDQWGNALGMVIVSSPITGTVAVMKALSDIFLVVSIISVLIAVVVTFIYVRSSSNPLRELAKAANAFGHGDLSARVRTKETSSEEIRELTIAFNNMAASLEQSENRRKDFVANVSHELKTPMTTIGGYIDGILDGTIPTEQQEKYLRIVSRETKRLSRLVRSMLDVSRLQEQGGIPEEAKSRFEAAELVGQVLIAQEGRIIDKNLQVDVDLPELPLYTMASRDHINQVLYNLVDNAIKFCPDGGTLSVSVRPGGNKLYITVSNDGPTIPANELPLLFERFHKLDRSRSADREGWGLGLYIVKTIICSHGEDISVTSENGVTAFTFTLPLVN
jgi:signal transduction histidine kinase